MTFETIEAFNKSVLSWGQATKGQFLLQMASMGLNKRVAIRKKARKNLRKSGLKGDDLKKAVTESAGLESLYESLKVRFKKGSGEIYFVGFPFARHGMFLIKGVSRGHKISNPRDKKDWVTPVLDKQSPILSDILAEKYADAVVSEILSAQELKIKL
jgi:hypothetical protein